MALTSDAGNDAPCDNLPQVSTQNLAHLEMPSKDELSLRVIKNQRYVSGKCIHQRLGRRRSSLQKATCLCDMDLAEQT